MRICQIAENNTVNINPNEICSDEYLYFSITQNSNVDQPINQNTPAPNTYILCTIAADTKK